MALEAFGDSKIMNGQVTLWQVVAAYVFALAGGSISTSLHLGHKPLCALISFAAGTLLGVTLFAILPESLGDSPGWAVAIAAATGYALFFFISKYIHHVCPASGLSGHGFLAGGEPAGTARDSQNSTGRVRRRRA